MKVRILGLIMVLVLLTGCPLFPVPFPFFYSAESIEAWIVDEETKEPLEGVVIVAAWELHWNSIAGRMPAGQLKVMETVTDKDGRFYFHAWGPELAMNGHLDNETPRFLLFKSGYRFGSKANDMFQEQSGITRSSDWSGKIMSLSKFKDSPEEYLDELFDLRGRLDDISEHYDITDCNWKKVPIITQIIRKEYANFPPYSEKCPSLKLKFLD